MLIRSKVAKWVGENARKLYALGFKLWYTGKTRVPNVKRISDMIIALKLIVKEDMFYVGLDEH
ncbi:hypothetical protein Lal_00048439 [Lupinus albus]|nr:hypothetical protein Lal_00048439 [Lupinus albus]